MSMIHLSECADYPIKELPALLKPVDGDTLLVFHLSIPRNPGENPFDCIERHVKERLSVGLGEES